MTPIEKLKAICDKTVLDHGLAPHDGKTYCNVACRQISEGMGYAGISDKLLANDIITLLSTAENWKEVSVVHAHAHALLGGLAFVAVSEKPHGHIAAVYPAPMQDSGSWGAKVPMLANVGKTNGVMKLSGVFRVAQRPVLRAFIYG